VPVEPELEELAMNQLNTYLARHEIESRLREVEHHRRIRRARVSGRGALRTVLAACVAR
jgi:hypothetical protein